MYHRLIRDKILPPGVAADDGAAIHFVDRKISTCVASRPHAKVYRVGLRGGAIVEEEMQTQYLA
jgi:peptidase E